MNGPGFEGECAAEFKSIGGFVILKRTGSIGIVRRGNGTFAVCTPPRSRGGPLPKRSNGFGPVTAEPGSDTTKNVAAAVTIATRRRQLLPLAHFRRPFAALRFMSIP